MRIKFAIFLLPLLWLLSERMVVAQNLSNEYPFLIITDHDADAPEMSDSTFNAIAAGIQFKVNRTEVNRQSPFILVWRQLLPRLKREGIQIRQLYLRGAASPDGPYDNNKRLGKARTDSLLQIIRRDLSSAQADTVTLQSASITEDYGYLVTLMEQANDPDRAVVHKMIVRNHGDELAIKKELQTYQRGRLWNRLKEQYFPQLRSARVVLWLTLPREHVGLPGVADVSSSATITTGAEPLVPTLHPEVTTPATPSVSLPQYGDSLLIRRHVLAARTNLIYDAWYQPQFGWAPGMNIQLEYYPLDGHITYNAGFTFHNHQHWSDYQFFQVRDIDLEARWYLRPNGVFVGPYAGVDIHGSWYGIGFSKTKGWEGEGGGAGVTLGWVWYLSHNHRWRLEANVGFGYFYSRHDPYVYGNPLTGEDDMKYYYDYYGAVKDFKKRNHQFQWLGPTQVGINLTYDILYRRIQKRGYGVRRTEQYKGSSQLQKGETR